MEIFSIEILCVYIKSVIYLVNCVKSLNAINKVPFKGYIIIILSNDRNKQKNKNWKIMSRPSLTLTLYIYCSHYIALPNITETAQIPRGSPNFSR